MNLSEPFIRRPVMTAVLTAAVVVFGVGLIAFGFALQRVFRLIGAAIAWKNRYAYARYEISRGMLIAHGRDSCRRCATSDNRGACVGVTPCAAILAASGGP